LANLLSLELRSIFSATWSFTTTSIAARTRNGA
jgi:hypothetical protein